MKKYKIDMLNGSLWDKVLMYALPLAVTGIFQQLFHAADIAVVGRFRGPEAMASVGSIAPLTNILINIFLGISLGTNVVLANAIGSGDKLRAKHCVHTSLIVAVAGGILLTIFSEFVSSFAIEMMNVPPECFKQSLLYLRIYLIGMPVLLLYNFEAAIFRAVGDTQTPFWALVISGIANLVLNVLLVAGANMSVDGVAIATVVSNVISSLYLLHKLAETDNQTQVYFDQFKFNKPVFIRILRIGIPAGIQGMMFSISNLVIQSSINTLGSSTMAGSAAALNIEIFAFFVLSSFGQTCTSFVGQNKGAKKYDRCRKILYICLTYSYIFTGIMTFFMLYFYKELLSIFCTAESVIEIGRIRLMWLGFAFIFSVIQDVLSGYLRGFGLSLGPALLSLICVCGVRLLWIFTAFKARPNFTTIMESYPLSLAITAVAMVILCCFQSRQGKLK